MATLKHRKLFPSLTSTTNCLNCYSYPDYAYFFPLPPPPPTISDQNRHVSLYVIIIVSIVSIGLLFLVAYYYFVVKPKRTQAQTNDVTTDEEFLGNQVDHPIWFIATVGLQQRIINSITICKYKKSEGLIEGTDCSVCLNEFREGETLRLLPKCNHAFHIPCIDTWLRSHTNCPLCRALILVSDNANPSPLVSGEQDLDSNSHIVDTQMENSGINDRLLVSQGRDRELSENREGSEENSEIALVNDHIQNKKIRRSFSMDSSFFETLSLDKCPNRYGGSSTNHIIEDEKKLLSVDGNSNNFRKMRSFSVARCLHKSPVRMKRSFSCSEKIFSSTRGLKSILPL